MIVILDDDIINCKYLKHLINYSLKKECIYFINYNDCIQYCKKNNVDVLFLDYDLGDTNSLKLISKIKLDKNKIILYTGYDDEYLRNMAIKMGISHFLYKPIDLKKLKIVLNII